MKCYIGYLTHYIKIEVLYTTCIVYCEYDMIKFGLLGLIILITSGCNLSRTEVAAIATDTTSVTEAVISRPTRTPIPFGITIIPTLLPLPGNDGGGGSISTSQPTL